MRWGAETKENQYFCSYEVHGNEVVAYFLVPAGKDEASRQSGKVFLNKSSCENRLRELKHRGLPYEQTYYALQNWPDWPVV